MLKRICVYLVVLSGFLLYVCVEQAATIELQRALIRIFLTGPNCLS